LADELQPHLPEDEARVLARVRDTLGPLVIVIRPVPDALLYDRAEFTVAAGRPVEIVFDNTDLMPHNLVITEPGALATVGLAAEDMAADADAWARAFVPDEPAVLYATRLLQPGESQTLSFLAPNTIGDHPYVCTFPGHWVRMNGLMKVVRPAEAREANDAPLAAEPQADTPVKRDFVRFWSPDDLRPHLSEVTVADPHAGSVIFEAARCQLCHQVGGVGGETGPDLIDVVGRHDRAALMTQILDPSGTILEGYESETIVTHGGGISSGRVLHEDDQVVRLQTDPYKGTWTEIPKSEIARRRTSTVSTMPDGLLSTFTQDEILALIAYLESLREET
jgi:putative heme-binding domain-containing protein